MQTVVDDLTRWYGDPGAEAPEETTRPDARLRPAEAVTLDHWRRTLSGVAPGHLTWLQREDASPSVRAGRTAPARRPGRPAGRAAQHARRDVLRQDAGFLRARRAGGRGTRRVRRRGRDDRRTPGVSPLVGCHLGLLPLLLRPGTTVSDTVAGTREALATALAHRQISAGEVTDVLPEKARLAVTFGFDDREIREVDLGGVRCVLRHVHPNALQFPLAITPWTSPLGHAGIDGAFDEGLYAPGTVDSLLAGWSALLAGPTTAEPRRVRRPSGGVEWRQSAGHGRLQDRNSCPSRTRRDRFPLYEPALIAGRGGQRGVADRPPWEAVGRKMATGLGVRPPSSDGSSKSAAEPVVQDSSRRCSAFTSSSLPTGSASAEPRPLPLTTATMQLASASRAAQSGAADIGTYVEDLGPGQADVLGVDPDAVDVARAGDRAHAHALGVHDRVVGFNQGTGLRIRSMGRAGIRSRDGRPGQRRGRHHEPRTGQCHEGRPLGREQNFPLLECQSLFGPRHERRYAPRSSPS